MPLRSDSFKTTIRSAEAQDYPAIELLVRTAKLPIEGVKDHLGDFLIMMKRDQLIGTVGLEIYGKTALLRSLAVEQGHQGRGYGQQLVAAIVAKAREAKLSQLFLLTETAEAFFAARGFETIPRDLADEQIKSSEEFRSLCPVSASCMRLII